MLNQLINLTARIIDLLCEDIPIPSHIDLCDDSFPYAIRDEDIKILLQFSEQFVNLINTDTIFANLHDAVTNWHNQVVQFNLLYFSLTKQLCMAQKAKALFNQFNGLKDSYFNSIALQAREIVLSQSETLEYYYDNTQAVVINQTSHEQFSLLMSTCFITFHRPTKPADILQAYELTFTNAIQAEKLFFDYTRSQRSVTTQNLFISYFNAFANSNHVPINRSTSNTSYR